MALYLQNQQTPVTWPEPFESTWQLLGGTYGHELAPKLSHLGLADILFMTTVIEFAPSTTPVGDCHVDVTCIRSFSPGVVRVSQTGSATLIADG